jgi:tRNA/rRNA methyltransferase
MNFGAADLRIVAPRDGWPNAKAHEMAAHAKDIIETARIYPTLPEALGDCQLALALSARSRDLEMPVYTVREAASLLCRQSDASKAALVFGAENNGLTNDEVACCHGVVTVPADARNRSLNLAQCVVIALYEWFMAAQMSPVPDSGMPQRVPASLGEIDTLYTHLYNALDAAGYLAAQGKPEQTQLNLRRMLIQAQFSTSDVQMLHGMVKALAGNKQ